MHLTPVDSTLSDCCDYHHLTCYVRLLCHVVCFCIVTNLQYCFLCCDALTYFWILCHFHSRNALQINDDDDSGGVLMVVVMLKVVMAKSVESLLCFCWHVL